jgi:hypothetical protein
VEPVFFPLDEELGLLPGTLAPRQQEHLVHLASCMPFKQAAWMLAALLGVQVSTETVRRLTERMGACAEAAQTAEVDHAVPHESTALPAPERCVLSVDGAMVSLVHQQWVEVRTVAIGEPIAQRTSAGADEIHVGQLSYFSRLADAATFSELAEGEMQRRQVREAQQVCAVTDGADWCQAFTVKHRPDAQRILDFPHAAEHVTQLLEALEQVGLCFPAQMLQRGRAHPQAPRPPSASPHGGSVGE